MTVTLPSRLAAATIPSQSEEAAAPPVEAEAGLAGGALALAGEPCPQADRARLAARTVDAHASRRCLTFTCCMLIDSGRAAEMLWHLKRPGVAPLQFEKARRIIGLEFRPRCLEHA